MNNDRKSRAYKQFNFKLTVKLSSGEQAVKKYPIITIEIPLKDCRAYLREIGSVIPEVTIRPVKSLIKKALSNQSLDPMSIQLFVFTTFNPAANSAAENLIELTQRAFKNWPDRCVGVIALPQDLFDNIQAVATEQSYSPIPRPSNN